MKRSRKERREIAAEIALGIRKKCDRCQGKGQIRFDYGLIRPNGTEWITEVKPCQNCGGRGVVNAEDL